VWISGLGLTFRKVLLASVLSTPAFAANWTITGDIDISPAELQTFQEKHPEIQDSESLEELLLDLSRNRTIMRLEAHYIDGRWEIRGEKALQVGEIALDLTVREFENDLDTRLYKYVGQIASNEVEGRIRDDIVSYLKSRGYYNPQFAIQKIERPGWVEYEFRIDEGEPCRIREIITGFPIPEGMSIDIVIGDICDEKNIKEAVTNFEKDLEEDGYNQRKILNPDINFENVTNSAFVFIPGSIGKKITVAVNSPVSPFLSSDLHEIDPALTDPELIKNEVIRKYREEGYDDVEITSVKKDNIGNDEVQYTVNVVPGPQYQISDVKVDGLKAFSRKDALDAMDMGSILQLKHPDYSPELLRTSVDNLTNYYQERGYWDAKVTYPKLNKNKEKSEIQLNYVVEEGKQRIFSGLEIQGNTVLDEEEIQEHLDMDEDEPLVWSKVVEFEKRVRLAYQKQGYLHATLEVQLVNKDLTEFIATTVQLKVAQGTRVKIGEITISGLVRTRPNVVLRELRFEAGDWYDPEKIEETRKALTALGLFTSVNIIPSDTSALSEGKTTIPFVIQVREGKPGTVSFGPGWSFDDGGRYVFESSYNNIMGTARQVFFKASISEERRQKGIGSKTLLGRRASVGYIEPYVLDLPVNGMITLGHKAEAGDATWEISREGEIAFVHTLRRFLIGSKVTGFYNQKLTVIEAKEALAQNVVEAGDVRIGRVGFRLGIDRRNNGVWPTEGYFSKSEVSWARYPLGSELRFFYWETSVDVFFKVTNDFVFVPGLQLASFEGVERKGEIADIIPPSERLHAGGADTNRGFKKEALGPAIVYPNSSTDDVITGGSKQVVAKVEFRYQIIADTCALTYFVDSSNVFFTPKEERLFNESLAGSWVADDTTPEQPILVDNKPYNFEDIAKHPSTLWSDSYVATGLALNYLTPLGSFNLSYGIPVRNCAGENGSCAKPRGKQSGNKLLNGEWHVNVGASF
jgi:outer membrane protein assembly complex protein YaeT